MTRLNDIVWKPMTDFQSTTIMKLTGRILSWVKFSVKFAGLMTCWLFAIPITEAETWKEESWGRWKDVSPLIDQAPDNAPQVGFTELDSTITGISFQNSVEPERAIRNRNLYGGSGVAVGDFDGDSWPDLYFCRLDGSNVLYKNLGGWKFQDVTSAYGLELETQDSTSAVFADMNGDGSLDLLVGGLGVGVRYFESQDGRSFVENTDVVGLRTNAGSVSLALNDYDRDGDLDLYVVNYRPDTVRDQLNPQFEFRMQNGRPVLVAVNGKPADMPEFRDRFELSPEGQVIEYGEADALYQNQGNGVMKQISWTGGAFQDENGRALQGPPLDWGLSAQFRDLNGDQLPDLIVCNDLFTPDRIWIQQDSGVFRALSPLSWRHTSTFSMGVDVADIDRDGDWDFFMTDMASPDPVLRQIQVGEMRPRWWPIGEFEDTPQVPFNTLQINRGDGTFMEAAHYAGVQASEWSWGPVFLDVDLDGYEDLLIPNGQIWDTQNADLAGRIEAAKKSRRFNHRLLLRLVEAFPSLETPNLAYRNLGAWRFERKEKEWGFGKSGITHGMALADLDQDGDQDIVQNFLNAPAGMLRNEATADRIRVCLTGWNSTSFPPQGIGMRITYSIEGDLAQSKELIAGGRYLSGDDPSATFAVPENALTRQAELTVEWDSQTIWKLAAPEPNRIYELDLGQLDAQTLSSPRIKNSQLEPHFNEVQISSAFQHQERMFDDFKRQPLLPKRLSQSGPPLTLVSTPEQKNLVVIGGGAGQHVSQLSFNSAGGIEKALMKAPEPDADFVALAPWDPGIVTLRSGIELRDGLKDPVWFSEDESANQSAGQLMAGWDPMNNYQTLAVGDVDADGDLDLWIGSGARTGSYPLHGPSWLWLRNSEGGWELGQRMDDLGIASSAVFTDWSGDGWPDLVVAVELGAVEFYENDRTGKLIRKTVEMSRHPRNGLWQSLAVGDWNRDGRMDVAVGNWGLNSNLSASPERPLFVYYGDFDGNGVVDIFEMREEPELGFEAAIRPLQTLRMATPALVSQVRTFTQYAKTSLVSLGGARWGQLNKVVVDETAHGIYWNRGSHFEWSALPKETQLAPAPSMISADVDGDGWEDLIVGQNFFAVNPDDTRLDAGRGLWLKNSGSESWHSVPGQKSGIQVYGEQRGLAVLDWNRDRKLDLVISQNAAETKFLENRLGQPGVRILLKGPPGNKNGYGAQIIWKDGAGAVLGMREVLATLGGHSASSSETLIFPDANQKRLKIQVRWPGGRITESSYSAGEKEVTIDWSEVK